MRPVFGFALSAVLGMASVAMALEPLTESEIQTRLGAQPSFPPAVNEVLSRHEACSHYASNSPESSFDLKDIDRDLMNLRCDRLERDEAKLLEEFGDNPEIRQALESVKRMYHFD